MIRGARRSTGVRTAWAAMVAASSLVAALAMSALAQSPEGDPPDDAAGRVHALFGFSEPESGPFPTDYFTVPDDGNVTGRRLSLPYPDCGSHPSDCDDLDVVNTLDGFGLQTRLSIPFDGPIDPATVDSRTVFLVSLPGGGTGGGTIVGINQIVWDPATLTLHVETDALLEQHQRYALIVTRGVRDGTGVPVKATKLFRHLRTDVAQWYREQLVEALDAAAAVGVREQDIVVASIYSTQSITPVMERIRDEIKAATPAPANFALGPSGERAVFELARVSSVVWRRHVRVNPDGFSEMAINPAVLQVVPGAVGTVAYGSYVSPDYHVHPGEYIPSVPTRTGTPAVQGHNEINFTLYLPSGPRPAAGWPIAITAGGASGSQHVGPGLFASMLAANGIAAIGINHVGQGFGPLGTLRIGTTDGSSLTIPDAGRGIDQDGDGIITGVEGSEAAAPRTWTISSRDAHRQTVADLMQLVRVIEVGMDADADGIADIDPSRIYFVGASAGSMIGTVFMALDPGVAAGTAAAIPGVIPEHARWQPNRRPLIGAALQARTPSLINAPGLPDIDGVDVLGPHFDENKPLRNQPPVVNTVPGAMAIQRALEFAEMVSESGLTPVVWARHLRDAPLPGLYPKSVLYQFATGDQQAVNPGTSALIRAGRLEDRAVYYRHDLVFAEDPTVPTSPHLFAGSPTHPNALFRSIARGVQDQIARFLASDGTIIVHPEPAQFFEVPIVSALPEDLNFIR